eukprot:1824277-Pyramimonas_sp.AAC.1
MNTQRSTLEPPTPHPTPKLDLTEPHETLNMATTLLHHWRTACVEISATVPLLRTRIVSRGPESFPAPPVDAVPPEATSPALP